MKTELEKRKRIASVFCNVLAVVLTAVSVAGFYTVGGRGNMHVGGSLCFRYFTVDSNILAAAASVPVLAFAVRGKKLPQWALIAKFIAATAVGVTFFTVMFFLGPIMGYRAMFVGNNFFMHGVTPILSMLSFSLFEHGTPLTKKQALLGVLPTAVYATVYLVMVVLRGAENGGWPDFYGFNRGGMWPISFGIMLLATAGLGQLLRLANRAGEKCR